MRVAIYTRVSTQELGQDNENQLRDLKAFCKASGHKIVREFSDNASGGIGSRDQFQAMLYQASLRQFDAILVWSLDRFTREGIAATFEYIRHLTAGGCGFISYTEPHLSDAGPTGALLIAVTAWNAEQERLRISERTKAGLRMAKANGKTLGRRVLQVDRERLFELYHRGLGIIPIAETLTSEGTKISKETVRKILKYELPSYLPNKGGSKPGPRGPRPRLLPSAAAPFLPCPIPQNGVLQKLAGALKRCFNAPKQPPEERLYLVEPESRQRKATG